MKREKEIMKAAAAEIPSSGDMEEPERSAFLAGAQWADEHPKNPWMSVDERLPEDEEIVLTRIVTIIEGGGERIESVQHLEQKYIGRWITDRMEQHRMGRTLFDTISKVTHWMPIPSVKGGEK